MTQFKAYQPYRKNTSNIYVAYKTLFYVGLTLPLAAFAQQPIDQIQMPPQELDLRQKTSISKKIRDEKKQQQSAAQVVNSTNNQLIIKSFTVLSDVQAVSKQEIQSRLNKHVNKTVTFAELQAALAKLRNWLRVEKGLIKAKVTLVEDKFYRGNVYIRVEQGTIKKIAVNELHAGTQIEKDVLAITKQYLSVNQAIQVHDLEEVAYRVGDYTNIPVRMVLKPLKNADYEVMVELPKKPRINGYVGVSNTGNKYTNDVFDTWQLQFNDVTNNSDTLYASFQVVTPNQKVARLRYEKPYINATEFGVDVSYSNYALCCRFESLDIEGDSKSISFDTTYHLQRTRNQSQRVSSQLSFYKAQTSQQNLNISDINRLSLSGKYNLSWSNSLADNELNVSAKVGELTINDDAQLRQDANSAKTNGMYTIANANYQITIPLVGGHFIESYLKGQYAFDNLHGSEKLSLGGLDAVRAVPYSVLNVDSGLSAQWQYRYQQSAWSAKLFVDTAVGKLNAKSWEASVKNSVSLFGAGLGVQWRPLNSVILDIIAAHELGNNVIEATNNEDYKKFNVWLTARYLF